MKSQDILTAIFRYAEVVVGVSLKRDLHTALSRLNHEGDSFLEIRLPQIDASLIETLRSGRLPRILGFRSRSAADARPLFLYGLWKRICGPDGVLIQDPDVNAIRMIRQISRTFSKVYEVCSDDRVEEAIDRFLSTDRELAALRIPVDIDALRDVIHWAFGPIIGDALCQEPVFRHGPGAVAESLDSVERSSFNTVSDNIVELVGYEAFRPTWAELRDRPPALSIIPARLHAVPKTAAKPRLITIEPSYNQFVQQGFRKPLADCMRRIPNVDITRQSRNAELAREGSISGLLATVDLSDASDRISMGVVRYVFGFSRRLVDILELTRSQCVTLPSGETIQLNKFAGMGSALTFPIQTLLFAGLAILTMAGCEGRLTRAGVRSYLGKGYWGVYGDDIVLPSKYYTNFVTTLERYGLVVNQAKSFHSGSFRESCGGDYWRGYDIAPVYLRRRVPTTKRDVKELVSLSAMRNHLFDKHGLEPEALDRLIESVIPYPYANSIPLDFANQWTNKLTYAGLARKGKPPTLRWDASLQRPVVDMLVPRYERRRTRATGEQQLSTYLFLRDESSRTSLLDIQPLDEKRLTHHGRPTSAKLKRRGVVQ